MATEIERKYLVNPQHWEFFKKTLMKAPYVRITQGYLTLKSGYHTRVRLVEAKGQKTKGFIASKLGSGLVRKEFEQELSVDHVKILLQECLRVVVKERRKIRYGGHVWEMDYYPDYDLVVVEVELKSVSQKIFAPPWVGKEVSGVRKYSNIALAKKPKRRKS